jgi:hypothetical protein
MDAQISVPHGIVFVLDPANKSTVVPPHDPASATASNETCVSIKTVPEVDGEVLIKLGRPLNDADARGCTQVFRGVISTPSGKLAIVTSAYEKVLMVDVPTKVTPITVSVDEPSSPGIVCVNVGEASRGHQRP